LASPTTRIASLIAAFCWERSSSAPTEAKPAREPASAARSASSSAPGAGIAPTLFAQRAIERFTRFPQPATSSVLLRVTN